MNRTDTLLAVGRALMGDPDGLHWGYELSKAAGVRSGTMYPVLRRLLEAGWICDGWQAEPLPGEQPARRYYRLTEAGKANLADLIALSE